MNHQTIKMVNRNGATPNRGVIRKANETELFGIQKQTETPKFSGRQIRAEIEKFGKPFPGDSFHRFDSECEFFALAKKKILRGWQFEFLFVTIQNPIRF